MKIELVNVGERLSLEMDPEGFEAVRSFIKRTYPDLKVKIAGSYDRVRFAGSEFLHEKEWDDPYLLSQTAEGDDLLKDIAAKVG
jgi:hypothetical protein